jgi:hypothetical protein
MKPWNIILILFFVVNLIMLACVSNARSKLNVYDLSGLDLGPWVELSKSNVTATIIKIYVTHGEFFDTQFLHFRYDGREFVIENKLWDENTAVYKMGDILYLVCVTYTFGNGIKKCKLRTCKEDAWLVK